MKIILNSITMIGALGLFLFIIWGAIQLRFSPGPAGKYTGQGFSETRAEETGPQVLQPVGYLYYIFLILLVLSCWMFFQLSECLENGALVHPQTVSPVASPEEKLEVIVSATEAPAPSTFAKKMKPPLRWYLSKGSSLSTYIPAVSPAVEVAPAISPVVEVAPAISPVVEVAPAISPAVEVAPVIPPAVEVAPAISPVVEVAPAISPAVEVAPAISPVVEVAPAISPVVEVAPAISPAVEVAPVISPAVDVREQQFASFADRLEQLSAELDAQANLLAQARNAVLNPQPFSHLNRQDILRGFDQEFVNNLEVSAAPAA